MKSCLSCKNGTYIEAATTYLSELKDCMIIIKNVPCMKCSQCGEVMYSGSVAEKLDELMDKAESIASELLIVNYRDKIA